MIGGLLAFSIRQRWLLLLLSLLVAGFGVYSLGNLPVDAVPDITNNQVQVISRAPSLAVQEVESFITAPIEVAVANVPDIIELRSISRGGRDYLLKIQEEEAQKTGIQSLKVGYNNVFGYYLEVRNTYKDQVPQEWIRKQTLANAERYITEELKQYEQKIMGADEQILVLETRLFTELVTDMQAYIPQIQADANIVARLDCLLSFAKTAEEHRYVRPVV